MMQHRPAPWRLFYSAPSSHIRSPYCGLCSQIQKCINGHGNPGSSVIIHRSDCLSQCPFLLFLFWCASLGRPLCLQIPSSIKKRQYVPTRHSFPTAIKRGPWLSSYFSSHPKA